MSSPQLGEAAPNVAVRDVDGRVVHLAELWQDGPVVLVFLRHFGCPLCKVFLRQLREVYPECQALDAEIVALTMGQPGATGEFCRQQGTPFVCLSDYERQAYQAFGLGNSLMGAVHPTTWLSYAREVLKGNLPRPMPPSMTGQMSGTFIIDRRGLVRFAHPSKTAADNPAMDELLMVLRSLAQPVLQ